MIRRILVPLDGTDLAEAALPVAAALCVKLGAEVVLVHLLEKRAPRAVHGRPHLATAGAAEAYLNQIAARRFPKQLKGEGHVHSERGVDGGAALTEHAGAACDVMAAATSTPLSECTCSSTFSCFGTRRAAIWFR